MTPTTPAALRASFAELPFHELIEVDTSNMSDDAKRILVTVIQEQRQSSQKRGAANRKQASKVSGKSKAIDITDFI